MLIVPLPTYEGPVLLTEFMTLKNAAQYLGRSRRYVRSVVRSGRLRRYSVGGKDRLKLTELDVVRSENFERACETLRKMVELSQELDAS